MILNKLRLRNFRIHRNTDIEFSKGINYIVGGNGQGKTSVLEAIYYLCTTKNFKSAADFEVLSFNEDDFEINGFFEDLTEDTIRIYYSLGEKRRYYLQNGKQINRAADVIGKFPVVLLTPEDHALTQGSPSDRRKFVDSILSQANMSYLSYLLDYSRTLKQRSSLLNSIQTQQSPALYDELEAWNEKLVASGSQIIKYRIEFVNRFNDYVKSSYYRIMDEEEIPKIEYQYFDLVDNGNIEKRFLSLLSEKKNEEIRRAANLIGPHRDEFVFSVNDKPLKIYGSQGQHKTFQVALKFAQYFYLKDKSGRNPIFLLDDVFGELDTNRAMKISKYLTEVGQTFITLTDFTNYSFLNKNTDDSLFKVTNGNLNYV